MQETEIKEKAQQIVEDSIHRLEAIPWHTAESDSAPMGLEQTQEYRSIVLGTVFAILPSGTCRELMHTTVESCPRCKGEGCEYCAYLGTRPAYEDVLMLEELKRYAEGYDASIKRDKAKRADLLLSQVRRAG
jgi:hypothetical protein